MANKNVIEVGLKKKVQPVRISGMNFEINLGQKHQKEMREVLPVLYDELEEGHKKLDGLVKNNDLEGIYKLEAYASQKIKEITTILLGDDAFEKIFEAADEDIYVVADAMEELTDKFKILQTKNKAQAFIDGKKR